MNSSALVVDASVAVKWVIWRNVATGHLAPGGVPEALAILRTAPVQLTAVGPLLDDILRYATLLRHPVYDCAYLALAALNGLRVVTADRRFARAVSADRWLARHIVLLANLAH